MRAISVTSLALAMALAAPAAWGQEAAPPSPLAKIYACADIADAAGRLACYDAEVSRVRTAERAGEIAAIDAARVEELQRESFGFQLPRLARLLPERGAADGPSRIEAVITEVIGRPGAAQGFALDNGQVWRVTDGRQNRLARAGVAVTISEAALGSFIMSVERGGVAMRVRRER